MTTFVLNVPNIMFPKVPDLTGRSLTAIFRDVRNVYICLKGCVRGKVPSWYYLKLRDIVFKPYCSPQSDPKKAERECLILLEQPTSVLR